MPAHKHKHEAAILNVFAVKKKLTTGRFETVLLFINNINLCGSPATP